MTAPLLAAVPGAAGIGSRRPARPSDSAAGTVRAGWLIILLFFGGLGTWSALAPLNAAVVGEAVVKVEGNRKGLQHLDGGTVTELRVREGDHVAAEQVVLVLDATAARADVTVLEQQQLQLLAMDARMRAELAGQASIGFPAELTDSTNPAAATAMAGQQQEFDTRARALAGEVGVLRKRIAQYAAQVSGAEAQRPPLQDQLASVRQERESLAGLLARGLATRSRVLDLERRESAITGQIAELAASAAASSDAIAELEQQIAQLEKERAAEITGQLRDVGSKLLEVGPRLGAARATLERTQVRAPYSGRVVDLAVHAVGAVVGRGERILDLVPDDSALVVEARIRVEDIADISPGMRAEVHFTSYKQRITPVIHGAVSEISADRLTDARTQVPYYVATLSVDPDELAASPEIQLYPGMPATVMITTKERSALDYLIGPFLASFDRAFRER
jgi:HlyD family type I secretion membrane fusion protein